MVEPVAAVGSGGDGGAVIGAGGLNGDGGGAHGAVGRGDSEAKREDIALDKVCEAAPTWGGLIVGEANAWNIDGDVGRNISERGRTANGWWSGSFAFDRGEASATFESVVANGGDTAGDGDGSEAATAVESIVGNGVYILSNSQCCEISTVAKNVIVGCPHRSAIDGIKGNGGEPSAAPESAIVNGGDAAGDGDGGEIITEAESLAANGGDAFGDGDGGESTAAESIAANGGDAFGDGDEGESTAGESITANAGHGIGMSIHGDAGGNGQSSCGRGSVVWARTVFWYHCGGEVGAVEEIVERLAGGAHQSNTWLSCLEHGCEGGVAGDGEGAGIVGANGSAGRIFPADEAIAAGGIGSDGSAIVGAVGFNGDGGGAHVVVGTGDRETIREDVALDKVGEVAPSIGGLIIGEGDAGYIDGDVGGDVVKRRGRAFKGWGSGRFAFNRGEAGAA